MIFMLLMNLIVFSFQLSLWGLRYSLACEERKGMVGITPVNRENEMLIRFRPCKHSDSVSNDQIPLDVNLLVRLPFSSSSLSRTCYPRL